MSGSADDRCIWCHGAEGELRAIEVSVTDRLGRNPHEESVLVHPRHAVQTRSFLAFVARHAKTFVVGMVTSTLTAVLLAVLITTFLAEDGRGEAYWTAVLYGPYAILAGLFIVRFPFSTPETVKWLGLAKSRRLARGLGWLFAGIGVWILATGPW